LNAGLRNRLLALSASVALASGTAYVASQQPSREVLLAMSWAPTSKAAVGTSARRTWTGLARANR
jgi:hypothetical protein